MDENNGVVGKKMSELNQAIRYHQHGKPKEVLKLEELTLGELEPREVRIEIQASTIHPSDYGLIQGSYGKLRSLPCVGGREGVGKVVEVGSQVKEEVLNKVVAVPDQVGAWQEFCEADVDDLILLPALVPYNQLAVSLLNPMTAWRLLNDFEYLREGDVIIQNAGNSAVGLAVLQFAKRMGVTCINLVRKEERIADLKNFGGEQVWIDDEDVPRKVLDFTEKKGCLMALNSVGGRSAVRLARCVRQGGVHVTFGAMDSDPIRFPTRNLIFDDVRFVGFWLDRWKSRQSPAQLRNSLEEVLQPLAMKEVSYPIDSVYSIEEYAEAISRNSKSRFGKVLLARDKQRIESSVS